MRSPRVKCLDCGSKTWHQPTFANGQRRITKTFEDFIEQQLTRLTIQDVVELYGLSWNTVCEIDLARLKKLARPGDYVVFLGAGSITQWAYALPGELGALAAKKGA